MILKMKLRKMVLTTLLTLLLLFTLSLLSKNTSIYAEGIQPAMWFMDDLNITQVPGGNSSHAGTYNFDVTGVNNNNIKAPFECEIVAIFPGYDSGNTVIIQSTSPVLYANGTQNYMSMAFGHDNDISDCYIGKKLQQGQIFYQTGNYGVATGVHSHVTCIGGKYTDHPGWIQVSTGNWTFSNGMDPRDCLFLSPSTNVYDNKSMNFKTYAGVTFDTYSIEKIEEYNIKASVWLSNPEAKTLSEIGIQCGSDKNTAWERTITTNMKWTRANLNYDTMPYYDALASDRLYYIRYYVVVEGQKYYSNWMEAKTKKAVITYDTYSIENLYDSDVRLSVWIDNPQGKKLTTIGIECGKTRTQAMAQRYVIDENKYWTRPNVSYYLSHFLGYLESNTRYLARYYVDCEDVTYYSDWFDITTPAGGVSYDTYGGVQEISDNDARPSVWLDNSSGRTISEIGFEWGKSKTSTTYSVIKQNVSWTRPHLNYLMSPYTGLLESNTTYYCRYYVTVDEKRYKCDWFTFTTTSKDTPHTHTYTSSITLEPSCTETGTYTYVCECGDTYTEDIPANGHQWKTEYTVDKEPTCTEDGTESIHCSVCNAVKEGSERKIDKTDHEYGDWSILKEATCSGKGTREKICIHCNNKVTEEIPAKGHTWKSGYTTDKPATCTEDGTESIHCSVCDAVKPDSSRIIDKLGHDYKAWAKKDSTTHERVCKHDEKHVETEAHKWDNGTLTKPVTESEDGIMTYKCTVCEAEKEVIIPSSNHTHQLRKVAEKKATCTEGGNIEYWRCSSCQKIFSDNKCSAELNEEDVLTPASGHKTETRGARKETCTEAGYSGDEICSVCGDTIKNGAVIPAAGHTPVTDPAVKPTVTSTGLTEGSHCSVCKKTIIKQEVIPKLSSPGGEKGNPKDPGSVAGTEKQIVAIANDGDVNGSKFSILQLRNKKSTSNANLLGWTKVSQAAGYIIYGNKCGRANRFKPLATVKGTSWSHRGLKKGTYYKYIVVAYKVNNGVQKVIASSKTIHVATTGGKVGNYKKVKVNKKTIKLKKGKAFKIRAQVKPASKKQKVKKHRGVCFESSNPSVAVVARSGKVKAKNKGTCYVFVYSQSGTFAKVKIKVN